MIKLSIIIPVYKVEKYIYQCVDSVLREAPVDSEIILVDDGSPDQCPQICDEYLTKDFRVKVIHKNNSGLSSARNAGLNIATGEYIFFIDSDDYIEEGYFEKLLLHRADMVIGAFIAFYHNNYPDYSLDIPSKSYETLDQYLEDFHCYFPVTFNTVWGKLYRREIIEKYHLRFREGVFMVEDILFNLEYYPYCKSVFYESGAILKYRQTEGTLSKKADNNLFAWYEESYLKIKALLENEKKFTERNIKLFYEKVYGNILECMIYAERNSRKTLKELAVRICNSNLAVKASTYNNSKKTVVISTAIRMKQPGFLVFAVKLYMLALGAKALWRKIK